MFPIIVTNIYSSELLNLEIVLVLDVGKVLEIALVADVHNHAFFVVAATAANSVDVRLVVLVWDLVVYHQVNLLDVNSPS